MYKGYASRTLNLSPLSPPVLLPLLFDGRALRDPLAFGSFMVAGVATAMMQAPPAAPLLATGGSVK